MIYADNSATTFPKPQSVYQEVSRAVNIYGGNPGRSGHAMSLRSAEEIYRCREAVAEFFHVADSEKIIFTSGCTQSLNTVIRGYLHYGDHVVISDLEHNSVARTVHEMSKNGITYTVAQTVHGDFEKTIDNFRKSINDKTRLMVVTHVSNVTGTVLPLSRIVALAHQYRIKVLADIAQSGGVIPLDFTDMNIDFVACAGHKGLFGVMGTGILYLKNAEDVSPLLYGGTGSSSLELTQPEILPDKFESGTCNVIGIAALRKGIEFLNIRGVEKIHRQEFALLEELYDNLAKLPDIRLYTPKPDNRFQAPLLSFNIGDIPSEEVAQVLNDRYQIYVRSGLHCATLTHQKLHTETQGTVRISLSCFNNRPQIQTISHAVKNIFKEYF